jgi:hypothetical protein
VAAMQTQADAELADPKLPTPCRNVLTSLQEHWSGLTRFLDDPRIPLDNNASERRVRGPALGRKNYPSVRQLVRRFGDQAASRVNSGNSCSGSARS